MTKEEMFKFIKKQNVALLPLWTETAFLISKR